MPLLGDSLFTRLGASLLRKHLDPARVLKRGRSNLRRIWSQATRGPVDEEQFSRVWAAHEEVAGLYDGMRDEQRLPFDYQKRFYGPFFGRLRAAHTQR